MSQVLKFGFPQKERLLCEAPGCTELATSFYKVIGDTTTEHFACNQHRHQMMRQVSVSRYVVLDEPGEHNAPPEEKKDA
jgi:hypothetical protein